MGTRTVYTRNQKTWNEALIYARAEGKSLSSLVEELLTTYVTERQKVKGTIVLEMRDGGLTWKFAGECAAEKGLDLSEYVERAVFDQVHEDMREGKSEQMRQFALENDITILEVKK